MGKRFLTMEEIRDMRLQQFDKAVSQVRAILEDFDYLNRETPAYHLAWADMNDAANELWALKNFAIKVVEP